MMKIRKYVTTVADIEVTNEDLAEEFVNASSDFQAEFLNAIGDEWAENPVAAMDTQALWLVDGFNEDSTPLNSNAREFIKTLASFIEDGE